MIDERAYDMLLDHEVRNYGTGDGGSHDSNCVIVVWSHQSAGAKTIGAINKLNSPIKVRIDMSHSTNVHMTPTSGIVVKVIPPNSIKYMGSIIIEDGVEDA